MDALPPDPYQALGVEKDATAAAIKSVYRKLVLKCHPDKVEDSKKVEAADAFHKIQSAYEILADEARRKRYDAEASLAEARKAHARETGRSRGGVDIRTAEYRMPTEYGDMYARGPERYAPRGSPPYSYEYDYSREPMYEERRPSYAYAQEKEGYFESQSRPNSRKYDEYERSTSKRSPKEERPSKSKTSSRDKENERSSRKDKTRRTEKDIRRDRKEKEAQKVTVEEAASDSEDSLDKRERAAREYQAATEAQREAYREQIRREKEAALRGDYQSVANPPAPKYVRNQSDAYDYINSTNKVSSRQRSEEERRPSPVRQSSSRENARPMLYRTGVGPFSSNKKSSREKVYEQEEPREKSRRAETKDGRQPPPLAHTRSAPPEEIRQNAYDRQRAQSVQEDSYEPAPRRPLQRSETMPIPSAGTRDSRGRKEGSKLKTGESAYATPDPTPEPESRYGHGRRHSDDTEYNDYRTEYREPRESARVYTRSPERMDEPVPERNRSSSNRQAAAPPLPRQASQTTRYRYDTVSRENSYSSQRPTPSRQDSGKPLYGEVPSRPTPSPRNSNQSYSYSPPPEQVRTSKRGENIKYATGRDSARPSNYRTSSSRQPVYA